MFESRKVYSIVDSYSTWMGHIHQMITWFKQAFGLTRNLAPYSSSTLQVTGQAKLPTRLCFEVRQSGMRMGPLAPDTVVPHVRMCDGHLCYTHSTQDRVLEWSVGTYRINSLSESE